MPKLADELDDFTLRTAIALDRGPRAWRSAALRAGSLADLGRIASARSNALVELLESVEQGAGRTAVKLVGLIERADPSQERDLMQCLVVGMIERCDEDYPAMLASCVDPPAALWIRGEVLPNDAWGVAVVGARRASAYGVEQAGRIACALASAEVTVVSGAARGIDAEVHRGALRAEGRTVAVIGGGLGDPYPPEHIDLLDEIAGAGGAVISECPMLGSSTPDRFPSRNRIIAGMTLGTLVIEAALRSGAIITANFAVELNRLCMALPGPVHTGRSAGCHHLISSMQASLIESADDVMRLLVAHASTIEGAAQLQRAGFDPPPR